MRHAWAFSALGARVVLVPERPERVPEILAAGFDAVGASVELDDIDGMVVCTQTGRHRASAAESAVPLLVEKPLAANGPEAEALVANATRTGQSVHVAYCLRFHPGIQFIAAHLGEIGLIEAADAECHSWLPDWRPGRDHRTLYSARAGEGGVLLDLSHEIDLLNHLLGPGSCVAAHLVAGGALQLDDGVESSAHLLTEHEGVPATLRLSFARRPEARRLRLFGRRGALEWDATMRTARLLDVDGGTLAKVEWSDPKLMYLEQAKAWLGLLDGQPAAPLATATDGLSALRIVDEARGIARWSMSRNEP
jgi:predicted dehydrogenase